MDDRRTKKYIAAVYRYGFSRLILHSILFYENMWERTGLSKEEQRIQEEFIRLLKEFSQGAGDLSTVEGLRDQISARVEILTAYSDSFQIYEYALNRVERRFVRLPASQYSPEEMAQALVSSLAGTEQAGDQNSRLRTIISHLPVRFTRQKFYTMVMERFTVYTGLSKASVENFLYMLKTSAMVRLPDHMDQEEELAQALGVLKDGDYRNMDQAGFDRCTEALSQGSRLLIDKTDFYVSLQEMVNELYILYLTKEGKLTDAGEDQAFWQGIRQIQGAMETGEGFTDQEAERILEQMEGIQEAVENTVLAGVTDPDENLRKLEKLVSGSTFVSLAEEEESGETADKEWIRCQAQELCQELDKMFASMEKAVVRSVMATVLSSLPLMFDSGMDVEDYIRASLESCSDYAEREACMELLEQELSE